MEEGFTVKEIAAAMNVTEMTILRQSRDWIGGIKRPKGKGLMYPKRVLPEKIQKKLSSIYKEQNGSPEPNNDDRTRNPSDDRLNPSPVHVPTPVEHAELVGGQIAQAPEQPAPAVVKPQREPRAVGRPKGSKGDAKIDGWLAIIRAWKGYRALRLQEPVVECELAFAKAYQRREIELAEGVYEAIPKISRATLCRKRIELRDKGVTALAGKEGAGRPK